MSDLAVLGVACKQVAKWGEPNLSGDVPAPRKGAAAAATLDGRVIAMFGGLGECRLGMGCMPRTLAA